MIPKSNIREWRDYAPWLFDEQVEQDLILSRIIVEIFSVPELSSGFAFRGGTALQKIYFDEKFRYSEDVDLVQIRAEPIGSLVNKLRERLDPWLGEPSWKQNDGRFTLYYKFLSETEPSVPMKVKIEINTREHFSVMGIVKKLVLVKNSWFSGEAQVSTYELEELLGTKLRALYQRKKGRDVLDIGVCLSNFILNFEKIIESFDRYISFVGAKVTKAQFEKNLYEKCQDEKFLSDTDILLPENSRFKGNMRKFIRMIHIDLLSKLPGESWRSLPENFFETL
jgi:predicted nucleotidyltransferase component of viral defense system